MREFDCHDDEEEEEGCRIWGVFKEKQQGAARRTRA